MNEKLIEEALASLEPFINNLCGICEQVKDDQDLRRLFDGVGTLAEAVTEINRANGYTPELVSNLETELLAVLKDLLLALESPDSMAPALEVLLPGLRENLIRWAQEGVPAMRALAVNGSIISFHQNQD